MPHDITGHAMYDMASGAFVSRKARLHAHTDRDKINRAPAKTQAALLEAMQDIRSASMARRTASSGPS